MLFDPARALERAGPAPAAARFAPLSQAAWSCAAHRKTMAEAWPVTEDNPIRAMNSKNPGFAVGMMERTLKGEVKAFFFAYATHIDLPDVHNLARPATTKTFNVIQEIYRHTPNNLYADVIFQAATWGEVEGIYISSERRLNICQKAPEPPPGCRPDLDMVIDKAKGIGTLLGLDMEAALPYSGPECGACADRCPVPGALEWRDGVRPHINQDLRVGCALGRETCILTPKAITVHAVTGEPSVGDSPLPGSPVWVLPMIAVRRQGGPCRTP